MEIKPFNPGNGYKPINQPTVDKAIKEINNILETAGERKGKFKKFVYEDYFDRIGIPKLEVEAAFLRFKEVGWSIKEDGGQGDYWWVFNHPDWNP